MTPTDIIPLINYAWEHSVAKVAGNKKAICERGWFPFNQNLLLHPELMQTMTKDERINARNNLLEGPRQQSTENGINTAPNCDPAFLNNNVNSIETISQSLNYSSGVAYYCAKSLLGHEILMEKKAETKEKQIVSGSLKDTLRERKRITAGFIFKNGCSRLGKTVLEVQEERTAKKQIDGVNKGNAAYTTYKNRVAKAKLIIEKKPSIDSWCMKDL